VIKFPIETERLRVRPFQADDAPALHEIWSDPANGRFGHGWDPPASAAETREWIERHGTWGVWERETGDLVGDCSLFPFEGEWELAYGLRRDRWGRGYATEAAAACVRAGFEQLGLERVVADIHRGGNAASERVLEKLGFRPWREQQEKTVYVLTRARHCAESGAQQDARPDAGPRP
jgi:RimJ/RimL family protein N-acetyltransferase